MLNVLILLFSPVLFFSLYADKSRQTHRNTHPHACLAGTPSQPPGQYLGSICCVSLSSELDETEALPTRLVCLFYDQSKLDRADGWTPEAGTTLNRGQPGEGVVLTEVEEGGGGYNVCFSVS